MATYFIAAGLFSIGVSLGWIAYGIRESNLIQREELKGDRWVSLL